MTTQPVVNDRYTAKGHPTRQHGSNFHTTTISGDYEDEIEQYCRHEEEDDIAEFAD